MTKATTMGVAAILLGACGADARPPVPAPPEPEPELSGRYDDAALAACLAEHHVDGVIALRVAGEVVCSSAEHDCSERYVPASTFKIVHTLIALDRGVLTGPEHLLQWDGVQRSVESWNGDHTLESAFHESVVWYYQEVARRLGLAREQAALTEFGYGNQRVGDRVDTFWLEGPLEISPIEQVALMEDIARGRAPATPRALRIVRDLMHVEGAPLPLFAKTGSAFPGTPEELRWYVGFAETEAGTVPFATLLFAGRSSGDAAASRRPVTECALRAVGQREGTSNPARSTTATSPASSTRVSS